MITSDAYGRVPYRLFKQMSRAKVTPAQWMDILDAYFDVQSSDPDFDQVERWIKKNTVNGVYSPAEPLDIHEVVEV